VLLLFAQALVRPSKSTFCQAIDTINGNFALLSDIIRQPVLPNDLSARKERDLCERVTGKRAKIIETEKATNVPHQTKKKIDRIPSAYFRNVSSSHSHIPAMDVLHRVDLKEQQRPEQVARLASAMCSVHLENVVGETRFKISSQSL
jgi:hypothetical protein